MEKLLDEKLLKEYLNKLNLRISRVKRIIKSVDMFENYLLDLNKTLNSAIPDDLDNFLSEYTNKYVSIYYIEDLKHYYALRKNKVMQNTVEKMKYKYTPPYKLTNFKNINTEYLNKLIKVGIKTNNQLLNACKSNDERKKLSTKIDIPLKEINKITKMSDLCRIYAVKSTRAELYYEAGIDTVEKIAKLSPEKLRNIVVKYAEENDFSGTPTLPKEAKFTVDFAKKLHKIAEF